MAIDPSSDPGATAATPSAATGLESFDELKALALETVRKLAGEGWTNFNESDPGVTILELLCYAITDLGYRSALPIEDLLTDRDGRLDLAGRQLFPPEQILFAGAVTIDDYRRVLLDRFDDLINCWVRVQPAGPLTPPALGSVRGRLGVALSVAPGAGDGLVGNVRAFLNRHRNLGERFDEIAIAPDVPVTLDGSLIVADAADAAGSIDALCQLAQAVLTPPVRFSPRELEGPLLVHGSLPHDELRRALDAVTAQHLVEQAVSQAPGVLALGADFKVTVGAPPESAWAWTYRVTSAALTFTDEHGAAQVARSTVPGASSTPPTRIFPSPSPPIERLTGRGMDVGRYYSIQDSLPRIYGLGHDHLDDSLPPKRRGEIRQLQGYLLHFEQLLANFLAQLAHAGVLLSAEPQRRTYHYQPVYDVPGCAPLLDGADIDASASPADTRERWTAFVQKPANAYLDGLAGAVETSAVFHERRRHFLDHLLARFGEAFSAPDRHTYETIENKEQFLAGYAALAARRTSGLETGAISGDSRHEPGLISALKILLRPGGSAEELTHHSIDTSLYLLETVLWLPLETDAPAIASDALTLPASLFDLRMLLVMGNWTMASTTTAFKQYVQDLAEARAPAHLMLHAVWLSDDDMTSFRECYQAWLDDGCRPLVLCTTTSTVPTGHVAVLSDSPAARLVAFLQQHWTDGAWPPGAPAPFGR